jgi:hypothetical protein
MLAGVKGKNIDLSQSGEIKAVQCFQRNENCFGALRFIWRGDTEKPGYAG